MASGGLPATGAPDNGAPEHATSTIPETIRMNEPHRRSGPTAVLNCRSIRVANIVEHPAIWPYDGPMPRAAAVGSCAKAAAGLSVGNGNPRVYDYILLSHASASLNDR
jgi:hypothetical protein